MYKVEKMCYNKNVREIKNKLKKERECDYHD